MTHYSHQFLAEQLLQFRTTPVYARYNFSASRTKYTSTKEKYRTPQEYTQNNSSTSHIKYTSTKEKHKATTGYIWTPLSLSATPFIPRTQGYKKLTATEMTASSNKHLFIYVIRIYTKYSVGKFLIPNNNRLHLFIINFSIITNKYIRN